MKSILKLSANAILAIILFASITSCKKNGTGGNASIHAMPMHHEKEIKGATVYLKFKSKEMPDNPTVNYDLKLVADSNEEHVHFADLLPGNYYLYAVGMDGSEHVHGGLGISIKYSDRKEEIDAMIPVTEE